MRMAVNPIDNALRVHGSRLSRLQSWTQFFRTRRSTLMRGADRTFMLAALVSILSLGCSPAGRASFAMSAADSTAIAKQISDQVRAAYDLRTPNVEQRMLALYPTSGRVVSAAAGNVVTSRDSVAAGARYFWRQVGSNGRGPQWFWDQMVVDVLAPNAAVMTARYHIPHRTPKGEPHILGGAWT